MNLQLPLLPAIPKTQPKKRVKPSAKEYEALCRTRLSKNFILRDFMFSVEAAIAGNSNFPSDNVDQVIESGKQLCSRVLEPIREKFGGFGITFGYLNRAGMDADPDHAKNPKSSSPHHWDRGTFGNQVYARVDIWPYCLEAGEVTKEEFGKWCMMNLDIDLFMMWEKANIFCITIGPRPRRVWLEWVPKGKGDGNSNRKTYMGEHFWRRVYPSLPEHERPKFAPSCTGGSMQWRR